MRSDMDTIILYAMRYTMGRMSYAPSDVADVIRRQWSSLTENTKNVMVRDLKEEIERHREWFETKNETSFAGPLGMECDYRGWCDLYDFMVSSAA